MTARGIETGFWRKLLAALYLLACVVGLVLLCVRLWPELSATRLPPLPAMLAAVLAWLLLAVLLGLAWRGILRRQGQPAAEDLTSVLRVQALAWLGRYLPFKAGLLLGKIVNAKSLNMDAASTARSVLLEQLAFLSTGALASGALLLAVGADVLAVQGAASLVMSTVLLSSLLLAAGTAGSVAFLWLGRSGREGRSPGPLALGGLGAWTDLLLVYALANLLPGLGMFALAQGMVGLDLVPLSVWLSVAATANVAGMLLLIAPAGLGARELAMYALLAGYADPAQILAFVLLFRALTIVADLLFVGLAWLLPARRRSPPRPTVA